MSPPRATVEHGLELAGNSADYTDAAGVRYAVRFGVTGERELYYRAARQFDSAHQLNPFGEYFLLHRVDLETAALEKHAGAPSRGALEAAATVAAGDWHNATAYEALARFNLA